MSVYLIDHDHVLISAWKQAFAAFPEVTIIQGDILAVAHTCVVSPANAAGYMDGGLDRSYGTFFGAAFQGHVMDLIGGRREFRVGSAMTVVTGHERIPYVILAPTMPGPEAVVARNAGDAFWAVLRESHRRRALLTDVYCPGLATGIGQVAAADAAREMAFAYGRHIAASRDHQLPDDTT